MTFVQIIGSLVCFAIGCFIFISSKSAIHEAVAVGFFMTSATLFAGGSITSAINTMRDRLADKLTQPEATTGE